MNKTTISRNRGKWGAAISTCNSRVTVNEFLWVNDPIYSHCYTYDESVPHYDPTSYMSVNTLTPSMPTDRTVTSSDLSNELSNHGVSVVTSDDVSATNCIKLHGVHSSAGYIVALAIVSTFCLILLGYVVMNIIIAVMTVQSHSSKKACCTCVRNINKNKEIKGSHQLALNINQYSFNETQRFPIHNNISMQSSEKVQNCEISDN